MTLTTHTRSIIHTKNYRNNPFQMTRIRSMIDITMIDQGTIKNNLL